MGTPRQETIERVISKLKNHASQFTATAFRAELGEWGTYIDLKESQRILSEYVNKGELTKKRFKDLTLYY